MSSQKNAKFGKLIAIILGIVILDQITKRLAEFYLQSASIPVIDNIIHLTLVHNRGAGFGILQGGRIFFIIFSIVILVALIYYWKKIPKNYQMPMSLIIGGLVGNLIDRIYLGYVIDFIDFRIWPVFNVADSAITIAAVWLIFTKEKKR